jgi:hypothetical protein
MLHLRHNFFVIHTHTDRRPCFRRTGNIPLFIFIRVAIRLFYKLCIDGWVRLLLSILRYASNS